MTIPYYRPRRLRVNDNIRSMVRETTLSVNDFIYPLFVTEGNEIKNPIVSLCLEIINTVLINWLQK